MKQMSLAHTGFELVTQRTRKLEFLDEMNLVFPWSELLALIAPHAPAGKSGRPPFPIEVMLRIHLLQKFFGHSDPAMEEALQDISLYQNLHILMRGSANCLTRARFFAFVIALRAWSGSADFAHRQRQTDRSWSDA